MKAALAQINTTIGDFDGNLRLIREALRRAEATGAELLVTPELAITGYPPRDLLLRESFLNRSRQCLEALAAEIGRTAVVVGYVDRNRSGEGREATNSAALLHEGRIVAIRHKTLLPTYDVFDEDRYFEPAAENEPVEWNGHVLGLTICEDVWTDAPVWPRRRYRRNPAAELVAAGARCLLNLSASPWHLGKNRVRHEMLATLARRLHVPLLYCNSVGGNDELIFDGASLALDREGRVLARGALFAEDLVVVDTEGTPLTAPPGEPADEEKLHRALVLGLRDYLYKCGFRSAVLGLSGGIDSAVTAALAVAALGPENVHGVALPSRYSSEGSLRDAEALARNLGIRFDVIPIEPAFQALKESLAPVFRDLPEDVTEENIQARLRGVILMALSNKFGSLLLTTGNKSELAVGYCTLYGDMCGGLAVINDLPKTAVYRLARWINREREIIPTACLTKPPSAELRPGQTDQDSLPPYEMLDAILEAYVVEGRSLEQIVQAGFDREVVRRVVRLIDLSEYKRRQAAPGLKVTSKAFGMGRRLPIAQRYREA
ncbi:MAG: NAD+ synthase [Verrucomicrobia bacterium]|nr:MAG: NAD+ synthase [Verrucomicrobiota bacterium]